LLWVASWVWVSKPMTTSYPWISFADMGSCPWLSKRGAVSAL
jgi:hypothetical protein